MCVLDHSETRLLLLKPVACPSTPVPLAILTTRLVPLARLALFAPLTTKIQGLKSIFNVYYCYSVVNSNYRISWTKVPPMCNTLKKIFSTILKYPDTLYGEFILILIELD